MQMLHQLLIQRLIRVPLLLLRVHLFVPTVRITTAVHIATIPAVVLIPPSPVMPPLPLSIVV